MVTVTFPSPSPLTSRPPKISPHPRFSSFLEDIDLFDIAAFKFNANEAISMDPQQRLLLELSAQVLAGQSAPTDTGVFIVSGGVSW